MTEATTVPPIDISPEHWTIVRDILDRHLPHHEVWAFGSRAKGTARPYSDLDLAIITDTPLSLDVRAALAEELSESDLPWRVDIVDWAAASESFRRIIAQDRVTLRHADARASGRQQGASVNPAMRV
ncbi:MAG: nucleotidyltransferase domain-containing protein [Thiocapsa sp.]|uniref:type VII toxin-antitoxin system MntA family adenylyltransferase antitoxin n=1 Tax=Thiocapsa sp. TaxID=2024551 RepID=UPI001BCBDF86|nr:nucleotidyltransferase domain-containing protein [Thiocapsa sp.]QVL48030.1 MAG: nucleotidyltransferase domain-containing protein [Thiocapsa sp.]